MCLDDSTMPLRPATADNGLCVCWRSLSLFGRCAGMDVKQTMYVILRASVELCRLARPVA